MATDDGKCWKVNLQVSGSFAGGGPAGDGRASHLRHLATGIMGTCDGLVVLAGLPGSHRAANGQCRHPKLGGGGRFPRSRAWCFRLVDGALHRGRCRLGTGSPQRVRAPALTWRPGGCGCGISSRSSTTTRTHGCGGMGPGRFSRPRWSWGTVGARTEGIQRSIADRPGKPMPLVDGRLRCCAAGPEPACFALLGNGSRSTGPRELS
jgi:hypothetical protein